MTKQAEELPEDSCPYCGGTGEIELTRGVSPSEDTGGMSEVHGYQTCKHCGGYGRVGQEQERSR